MIMPKNYLITILLSFLIIFSFALPVKALTIINPITATTFEELIEAIVNLIFYLGMLIAPIMFIFAGIFFITAAGDSEKIQKAKNMIWWTVIGLILVIMAKGIIEVIQDIFS